MVDVGSSKSFVGSYSNMEFEICRIQEIRWKYSKERKDEVNSYLELFGYMLYIVLDWENEEKVVNGGVGIILGRMV